VLLDFLDVDSFAARISRDGFNIGGTVANGRVRFVRCSSCIRTARLPSSSSAVGVRIAFGLESLHSPLLHPVRRHFGGLLSAISLRYLALITAPATFGHSE
jgi:hypothetical protein